MLKKSVWDYAFFILGIFILALGVNFMISVSQFGMSPWDAFYNGLFSNFGISIGFWIFVANGIFLLFILKTDRNFINIGTIISFILMSVFVDFAFYNDTIQSIIHSVNPYASFIIGALLIGFGLGMYIATEVGFAPHDAFILSLSKTFNWSFRKAAIVADSGILLATLLLKGPVFVGTIIMALTTGFIIQFSIKINKVLLKKVNLLNKKDALA